ADPRVSLLYGMSARHRNRRPRERASTGPGPGAEALDPPRLVRAPAWLGPARTGRRGQGLRGPSLAMAPGGRACRTGQISGRTSGGGVVSPRGVGVEQGQSRGKALRFGDPSPGATPVPPVVRKRGSSPGPSHATPCSVPDPRARVDSSRALISF